MPNNNNIINLCKAIKWVDNSQPTPSVRNIQKVVYCDNTGTPHDVWPTNGTTLSNVYLVELGSGQNYDVAYRYTITNNNPDITIKPNVDYAIRGDILLLDGNQTVTDQGNQCYFVGNTVNSIYDGDESDNNPHITNSVNVATSGYGARTAKSNSTGQDIANTTYIAYHTYRADNTPGKINKLSVQGQYPLGNVIIQNGYLFDPNYTTPVILKRADINTRVEFFDSNNNQLSNPSLEQGESITIHLTKHQGAYDSNGVNDNNTTNGYGDGGSSAYLPSSFINSGSSYFTVADNNNGTYTITAISPGTGSITFDGDSNAAISFGVNTQTRFQAFIENTNISNGTKVISIPTTVTIKERNSSTGLYETYNGSYTMSSSNTSVASCSGNVITPGTTYNTFATITVTIPINGINYITTFSVESTAPQQTYYAFGPIANLGSYALLDDTNPNIVSGTGATQYGQPFVVKFATNYSGTYSRNVGIDSIISATNGWSINVNNASNTSELQFNVQTQGSGSGSFTFNVYADSSHNTTLGQITVNIS